MCTNAYMSGTCIESKESIDSGSYRIGQTFIDGTNILTKLVDHLEWKKVLILYQRGTGNMGLFFAKTKYG